MPTQQNRSTPDHFRTLVTFAPCFGLRSPSPFTLKVEALLTMAELPYDRQYATPQAGPRGKLPVLKDGSLTVPDSRLIRRHIEHAYGVDFDEGLDADQRALAVALQRICEEHLYFVGSYFRWNDHHRVLRDSFFGGIPRPLRDLVTSMIRRQVRRDLHGQGLGRMTRDEVVSLAKEDLTALAVQLGDKPYMFGDRPTGLDATAYGLLANIIVPELESPITAFAAERFGAYVRRFEASVLSATEIETVATASKALPAAA